MIKIMWLFKFFNFAVVMMMLHGQFYVRGQLAGFDVSSTPNGEYKIAVDKQVWLRSAPTWFQVAGSRVSQEDMSLKLVSHMQQEGYEGNLGKWTQDTYQYEAKSYRFTTKVRVYPDLNLATFGQIYENDTLGTSSGNLSKSASGFPSFALSDDTNFLGYYANRGYFGYDMVYNRWTLTDLNLDDGEKVGPIYLFDGSGHVMVMSQMNKFMSTTLWYDKPRKSVNFGPLGRADMIPKGYEMWTMVYYSNNGVNKAVEGWGNILQIFHNSQNKKYVESDIVVNYLGYWTDAGAYYYYQKEDKKDYEQTMLDVITYAQSINMPYRYIQYDSWYYPKDPKDDGILDWYPDTQEFPHGQGYILNKTGLPSVTHSRYWSPNTPLAKKNGGKYDFEIETLMSFPEDPLLFDDVMVRSKKWGNTMLLQDWVGQMFGYLDILQTNVTAGEAYMMQMSTAALRSHLTIELCTAYPRHSLTGLQMPSVTMNRASGDYRAGQSQWTILGLNSLWLYAIGQTPFKDVLWSTERQDCPKYPGLSEPWSGLNILISTLSMSAVAIGDGIGKTNRSLVMRCCNEDGLILKPSKPATSIDSSYYKMSLGLPGPNGEVWTSYSIISNLYFGIIFGTDLKNTYSIGPKAAGFVDSNSYIYSYEDLAQQRPGIRPFSDTQALILKNCTRSNFCLYYTTPVFKLQDHNILLLGERDKWVPMSLKRIQRIGYDQTGVGIELTGAINEIIPFVVAMMTTEGSFLGFQTYNVDLGSTGSTYFTIR